MRKPKLATFFTVAQAGSSFFANVPAATITASVQPPTVSVGGPGAYVFKYYVAPPTDLLSNPLGNDANDGLSPTVTGTGHGPWTIGSLLNPAVFPTMTNTQKFNNSQMAGQQVGLVGDQGVLSLSAIGLTYPSSTGSTAMVLQLPSGTASSQTVLASCNSSKQYVARLAVLDGGITTVVNNGLTTTNVTSSFYMIGRFSLTNVPTDSQYITIDGLEVRNCCAGGIVFGQSGPSGSESPGWVAINNYIHHVYNPNEGFAATACSQSGTNVTIGGTVTGTVNIGDSLFGIGSGNGGFAGKITAQQSGTTGGAGVYTSSASGTAAGPSPLSGSVYAGNNTAGMSFHGGTGIIQKNNFISDVIDLNTAIANNKRAVGIKNWATVGGTTQFNTIYATQATGYPVGGIEYKDTPQYNNLIANNYIHLANAGNFTGTDILATGADGNSAVHTIPAGGYCTVQNNIIIPNPNNTFGIPTVGDGLALSALTVNWVNNTMKAVAGNGGWLRFAQAGLRLITFHDNIIDRPNPPNNGDWRTNVDAVVNIDFNVWPSNYSLTTVPSGAGSPVTTYSPTQNGGIAGLMSALTTASGGATTGLEHNGGATVNPEIGSPTYANASGTFLKASDWQLSPGSKGYRTGTGGNDKGAWGGQTQIGCNFKDPSG